MNNIFTPRSSRTPNGPQRLHAPKSRSATTIRRATYGAAALLLSFVATTADAVPVQFAGTGHYYEHIAGTFSWTGAREAALGLSFNGQSGYLATITSAGENTFLGGLAGDGWIGGTDSAVEGVWRWVDGPEAGVVFWNGGAGGSSPTFANWNVNEPNDQSGEDFAQYHGGNWNDLANGTINIGYFVEYNASVPEPLSVSLVALGLLGAGFARRRRTRARP